MKELKTGISSTPFFTKDDHAHLMVGPKFYEAILRGEEVQIHIHVYKTFPFITPTGIRLIPKVIQTEGEDV